MYHVRVSQKVKSFPSKQAFTYYVISIRIGSFFWLVYLNNKKSRIKRTIDDHPFDMYENIL